MHDFANDTLNWNTRQVFVLMSPICFCFPAGLTHMIGTGLNYFCSASQQTKLPHPLCQRTTSPITYNPDLLFSPLLCTKYLFGSVISYHLFAGIFWGMAKRKHEFISWWAMGGEAVVAFCDKWSPRVRHVLLSQRCVELSKVYLFARSWCLKTEDVQFAEGMLGQVMMAVRASSPACWHGALSLIPGDSFMEGLMLVLSLFYCIVVCSLLSEDKVASTGDNVTS